FVLAPVDLSALVRGLEPLLVATLAHRAVLSLDLAAGLPVVGGDVAQLRQLVLNLVTNAAEALPEGCPGRVSLSTGTQQVDRGSLAGCRCHRERGEGPHVWLEVQDDGSGMTPGVLSRAFEPFFSTRFTGRGLGLSAVRGIVRSHGGALHIASAPGKGTS